MKKYYGKDPIKKIFYNKKNREKIFKIFFIVNIWVWFSIFLGALIFIFLVVKRVIL
ncbi:hypothetical protein J422_04143 [Methanocaldococcus villosus KIN24-T80]|uniref:Uncharacterized protein n=1 Tax=Methanocaldococcus villosus KIN24-T80 TaxID=1069083 RepID=N6VSI5_9EURY|nr:hypothetical protein J422_04143 [Methanocaldococcus villosus KIN24-T80]